MAVVALLSFSQKNRGCREKHRAFHVTQGESNVLADERRSKGEL